MWYNFKNKYFRSCIIMKRSVRPILVICIFIVAALLAGAIFYGYTLYLDEQAAISAAEEEARRQAEIAAFYATPDVAMVVDEQSISELEKYTNLQNVDLTGSTCYAAILQFIADHPGINVTYTVDLGGWVYDNTATEVTMAAGTFDYEALAENLQYLPGVTSLSFPLTDLTLDQITSLRESYPEVSVAYTVELLGEEVDETFTSLDLSAIGPGVIDEIADSLAMLPNITSIELMTADGTSPFSQTDVKALMDACPGLPIHYTFELFGVTVSTETETLEYRKVDIGNEGEAQIRAALDIMPNCTYAKFDTCGIDSDVMASIRDDYPNTKVVWRVFFGKFNTLTDNEMLRLTNGLTDDDIGELFYCTDVKYMDLGHNEKLTDISFIKNMPELQIVILSGSIVSDLSVFENHQNIEFLELCFCTQIEDLTPLANCPNLKYLNVSSTKVSDLSALDGLPLERFICMSNSKTLDSAAKQHFKDNHPNCLYRFNGSQPYGYGWRYDDYGYTFWEYYANMRVIFMYDDVGYYTGKENK